VHHYRMVAFDERDNLTLTERYLDIESRFNRKRPGKELLFTWQGKIYCCCLNARTSCSMRPCNGRPGSDFACTHE